MARDILLSLFKSIMVLFLLYAQMHVATGSKEGIVYEMDDRIIDYTTQGKWLIMFYAPWCGHCKKLEPVFDEIGKYYEGKMNNIAKVDATRYIKAANHFQIKGYPTIKFVYGKANLNFHGERKKEDIIEFMERADAPRVSLAYHELDFENVKHKIPLFFLLVARKEDEDSQMKKEYFELAEKHFLDAYFYYAHPDHIKKTVKIKTTPRVGVIKDSDFSYFDPTEYTSMEQFVKLEQFLTFAEISLTNFHNMLDTKKILVILLIDPKDESKLPQTRKLRQAFKIYSKTQKRKYQKEFQFGFTENNDLLNGIAIWTLPRPILFILNTTSYQYALVNLLDSKNKVIEFEVENILNDVRENKLEWYGGHSMFRNIRRPLWELYRAIIVSFVFIF